MSKVSVEVSTLQGIGDAIRAKDGTTELIPVSALAERITAIPAGGGDEKFRRFVDGSLSELTAEDLNGVTYIRSYMFSGMQSLEKVVIPDNVLSICEKAFAHCQNLTDITIGAGTRYFYIAAFDHAGYYSVEQDDGTDAEFWRPITIRFLHETPPFGYQLSLVFPNCEIEKIIVPKGALAAWQTYEYTREYADKMEEDTE